MAACPRRTERAKPLYLTWWNENGLSGIKFELELFLNQHGVHICLLSVTFLDRGQNFRLANYVCHRTELLPAGAAQPSWFSVV
jgi:hypothetical protein